MLFDLPPHADLYAALADRDKSWDGRAYVGVSSTGIFCRFGCPARTPKPENCAFFETVAHCMEAGFRPCKRCHPLKPAAQSEPVIQTLLDAFAARPDHRWREGDVAALGVDPSTARRAFKRHYGLTFLEMVRLDRLRRGFETLSDGGRVIDAQIDAGFESPSAFREAFAKLLGDAPGNLAKDALLRADWVETPLGPMIAVADAKALHLLEFIDRKALPKELADLRKAARGSLGFGRFATHDQIAKELEAFFAGTSPTFQTPISPLGTPFSQKVWAALRTIPAGATVSYGDLARQIEQPTATRAVARANGANPLALIVPCHRVIGADGSLTGYGGGLWRKQKLIEVERAYAA
ncbi:bifunctional transcriptional activator/DNA repair enzyme AdaA [Pontivivens insulae]|uniref:methylated-DNA--[protein]-cysteine S-methyltransferase n=1 Tax=Pontivivens insulae TaxID=1639689 RepID=A0A2R8A8F4_9RHOB|nr:trifunctional transcriptional activator/DNA repair protein Ada/methylated-DNA--[protein]-cysteine S-methyltransferase [Pontivivens insulae]RED18605.1 DNA-O6-methylguanine--protein-cysteine S-methyltransferase /transcriptional regulator Ada [Pontivivens insulae]SPF28503.1 Bifunctional transcriptional activator/DNA repair enzyme Ada [Pontivivens insulae]